MKKRIKLSKKSFYGWRPRSNIISRQIDALNERIKEDDIF